MTATGSLLAASNTINPDTNQRTTTMTPALIDVIGRLAALGPAELAVVGATAGTLATQAPAQLGPQPAPHPKRSVQPRQVTIAADESAAPPRAVALAPRRHPRSCRPNLLITAAWDTRRVDPGLFSSAAYRSRLGPTAPVLAYIAGCDGLRGLAERIGAAVWKLGVTEAENVRARLSLLEATRYGSCVRRDGRWHENPGFGRFEPAALPLTRRRGPGSPIRSALQAIAVERPLSLPLRALDRALGTALAPAGLRAWAAGPDAAARCAREHIDPGELDRHTPAVLGRASGARPRRATELTLVAPRAQADDVADVLERIIADHVMGKAAN